MERSGTARGDKGPSIPAGYDEFWLIKQIQEQDEAPGNSLGTKRYRLASSSLLDRYRLSSSRYSIIIRPLLDPKLTLKVQRYQAAYLLRYLLQYTITRPLLDHDPAKSPDLSAQIFHRITTRPDRSMEQLFESPTSKSHLQA